MSFTMHPQSPLYCIVIVTSTPSSHHSYVFNVPGISLESVDQSNRSFRPLRALHGHFLWRNRRSAPFFYSQFVCTKACKQSSHVHTACCTTLRNALTIVKGMYYCSVYMNAFVYHSGTTILVPLFGNMYTIVRYIKICTWSVLLYTTVCMVSYTIDYSLLCMISGTTA